MDKQINLKGKHSHVFRLDNRTDFIAGILLLNVNADAVISVEYNKENANPVKYMDAVPIKYLVEYFAKSNGRDAYLKVKGNVFPRVFIPLTRNGGGLLFNEGTSMDITLNKLNSRDTDLIIVSSMDVGYPYRFIRHEVPKNEQYDLDLTGVKGLAFKEDFDAITLFKDYEGDIYKREVVRDELVHFNEQFRCLGSIDDQEKYGKMFVNVYPVSSVSSAFIQGTNKAQEIFLYY